jgi:hypothetical protein
MSDKSNADTAPGSSRTSLAAARKFKPGDRVRMSQSARDFNSRSKSYTGVVVGYTRKYADQIFVKRDGIKTLDYWSEEAWELMPNQ